MKIKIRRIGGGWFVHCPECQWTVQRHTWWRALGMANLHASGH